MNFIPRFLFLGPLIFNYKFGSGRFVHGDLPDDNSNGRSLLQ